MMKVKEVFESSFFTLALAQVKIVFASSNQRFQYLDRTANTILTLSKG